MADDVAPDGWVFLRSTVEYGTETDEEWAACPRAEWDAMTAAEQGEALTEMAVNHQNNVAPCGAGTVEDRDEIPGYLLADPEGHRW